MKIIVFAYKLVVSGTTVNSIELAAALRDLHGFDVVFFATPGPLVGLVEQKRLRYIPAPEARFYPSPARMCALRHAVRQEQPDIVYAWDWPQAIDAFYGVHLPRLTVYDAIPHLKVNIQMVKPRLAFIRFG